MKIRQGFVSNSSSSSFIVKIEEHPFIRNPSEKSERQITKEQEDALFDLGFRYYSTHFVGRVENDMKKASTKEEYSFNSHYDNGALITARYNEMIYYHSINSEDIVEELVKLGVPFKMLYNYGTTIHIWKPWKRNLLSFTNFGDAYEMGYIRREGDRYYKPEGIFLESLFSMLSPETWQWLLEKEVAKEKFQKLEWS